MAEFDEKERQQESGITSGDCEEDVFTGIGDVGTFDFPDIDLGLIDFLPSDEMEETRYTLPKVVRYDEESFVLYDNARKLGK